MIILGLLLKRIYYLFMKKYMWHWKSNSTQYHKLPEEKQIDLWHGTLKTKVHRVREKIKFKKYMYSFMKSRICDIILGNIFLNKSIGEM